MSQVPEGVTVAEIEQDGCRKCGSVVDVQSTGYCSPCELAFWADMQPGDGKEWPE